MSFETVSLTKRYLLALAIIGLLALLANVFLNQVISSQDSSASVINVSGRQRMLSQRIAMKAFQLVANKDSAAFETLHTHLQTAVELMKTSHEALTRGNRDMNIASELSAEMNTLYFESPHFLDRHVREYLAAAKVLLETPRHELHFEHPQLAYIDQQATEILLVTLDQAVKQYEQESRIKVKGTQYLENGVLGLTLLCLVLEVLFIFKPMVNTVQKTQDSLKSALKAATLANKAKSTFLANISHELRTPMNGILGASTLLLEHTVTSETKEYAGIVHRSASDLLVLINSLIDYSAIESGDFKINKEYFDLHVWIKNIESIAVPMAREKALTFDIRYTHETMHYFIADHLRMQQILMSLVSNGLKFTERGGVKVMIQLKKYLKHAELIFNVQDSGVGITAERMKEIFTDFSQADTSMTRRVGGVGLGLTLCRAMVLRLGGTIHVQSEPGCGSLFVVNLPVEYAEAPSLVEPVDDNAICASRQVLLVEDNIVNQKIGCKILQSLGADVDIAENGEVAVYKVQQKKYDIILMDLQMPVMDGITATQNIRALGGRFMLIPIVAVTANTAADKGACERTGMNGFLNKPINRSILANELKKHLVVLPATIASRR